MALTLYIANKNYSSWSLRGWLALRAGGIAFEEVQVPLGWSADSVFKRTLAQVSPAGRVPVLVDHDQDQLAVWDSLAIIEYAAERFPQARLWPQAARERARARSLCAEMHAGFSALRNHCPMNIEADLSAWGPHLLRRHEAIRSDVARIETMWTEQLQASGGPFLFGRFTAADAFFAPVVWRLRNHGIPVSDATQRYIDTLLALPAMQEWTAAALAERDFVVEDEPYRTLVDGVVTDKALE